MLYQSTDYFILTVTERSVIFFFNFFTSVIVLELEILVYVSFNKPKLNCFSLDWYHDMLPVQRKTVYQYFSR